MKISDVDLLELLAIQESRECFWAYRKFMNPTMKIGWWQKEVSYLLQRFAVGLNSGQRPKLVIEAPPQHGKSRMVVEFITWLAGLNPDCKTIYTSFSDRLGIRANLMCQRVFDSDRYKAVFPHTAISRGRGDLEGGAAVRNHSLLEYVGRDGSFRNTTVRGSITGEGLDLGVIDDPIKGREEAGSANIRDKTWEWLTDDFFTRFSEDAGLLSILTRWHVDDPIGRLRRNLGDDVEVASFPAIAVVDEEHRAAGEALFPEHKSLGFLQERRAVMARVNWEALYQQNPQVIGGEIVKGKDFKRYTVLPPLDYRMVYSDTAQKTKERNDFSVFQCWGKGERGIYLIDQIRGKWEAPELERRAKDFWAKHQAVSDPAMGNIRKMKVEDKASGTGLIQKLKTEGQIPIEGIARSKDKYTRMGDVLGYIESGYIYLPDAPFTADFIGECEAFTADDSHQYDDQVDPLMDAIEDMLLARKTSIYDAL